MPYAQASSQKQRSRRAAIEKAREALNHWTTSGEQHIIIVSNRGPVEHQYDQQGAIQARRGAGGLVTALQPLALTMPAGWCSWVALAMTSADRAIAARQACAAQEYAGGGIPHRSRAFNLRFPRREGDPLADDLSRVMRYVTVPPQAYKHYYDQVSNGILWFLQHSLWNTADEPTFTRRNYLYWQNGYQRVNQAMADAVCEEVARKAASTLVLFQDYHLYLAPGLVRAWLEQEERDAETILGHFVHIPWPAARAWQLLPRPMLLAICQSLLANDLVGFQTPQDTANFLATIEAVLPEAQVQGGARGGTIAWQGRVTRVRAYPISIDPDEVRQEARRGAYCFERELRPLLGTPTIVRVDRLDPSKNILRGFQAFRLLLERYPALQGRIKFLAFLVPTRQGLALYRRYERQVRRCIEEINATFGRDGWQPIEAFFENNRARALAALRHYDVLLINPLIDGMNLVAKEGPVVNERAGVVVLSQTAGAAQQLGATSLLIAPTDIEQTAQALLCALTMPYEERQRRAALAQASIEQANLATWLRQQLADVEGIKVYRAHQRQGKPLSCLGGVENEQFAEEVLLPTEEVALSVRQ